MNARRRRAPLPPTRTARHARRVVPQRPAEDGPLKSIRRTDRQTGMDEPRSTPVLDPFEAYADGELELRRRLTVLPSSHLVSIVVTHRMTSLTRPSLECIPAATLVEVIILAVTRGAAPRD
jgi:hypothetical protein